MIGAIILLFAYARQCFARFDEDDPAQIDPEQRLSSEYYNDIVSYRFPMLWEDLWYSADNGYQVSAGSFNVNRFLYIEEIKLHAASDRFVDFRFVHQRLEGLLTQEFSQEIRFSSTHFSPIHISLMGDGGTFKKWGDLGMALGWQPSSDKKAEIYYWSVDHFYNTKEEEPLNYYIKKPITYGLLVDWSFAGKIDRLYLKIEVDTPLKWQRIDKQYIYEVRQKVVAIKWLLPWNEEWTQETGYRWALKNESNRWFETKEDILSNQDHVAFKAGSRKENHYQLGLQKRGDSEFVRFLMEYVDHQAEYDNWWVHERNRIESDSPDTLRREWMLSATRYFPYLGENLQLGLFYNRAYIVDDKQVDKGELKLQTAIDFVMSEQWRLFLNVSWDLDQIYREFGKRFRPWGGGNLQIQALF